MSDDKSADKPDETPDGPQQIPTKKIVAVKPPLTTPEMLALFQKTLERFESKLDGFGDDVQATNLRLTDQGERLGELEKARSLTSARVRATSDDNLTQDAAIAKIVTDVHEVKGVVDALKQSQSTQTTMLKTNTEATLELKRVLVTGVAGLLKSHPIIVNALVGLIVAVIVMLTTWVKAGGH